MRTSNKIVTVCLGMMMMMSTSMVLTNCKKDTKDPDTVPSTPTPTPTQSNTERLTGKNYKMTALTVEPSLLGISDLYSQMDDCQKDNIFRFDTPNVYKEDEGATKCNTNDAQTLTGTWVWNTDETILTTSLNGETISYNVITNDGTTLKIKHTESLQGTNYILTGTFVKQ